MSHNLTEAAAALRRAGEALTSAGARAANHDPGGAAFGAARPGRLGEVGLSLHELWRRALDARAREAAAHGARLDQVSRDVARAVAAYAEADDEARRLLPGGS